MPPPTAPTHTSLDKLGSPETAPKPPVAPPGESDEHVYDYETYPYGGGMLMRGAEARDRPAPLPPSSRHITVPSPGLPTGVRTRLAHLDPRYTGQGHGPLERALSAAPGRVQKNLGALREVLVYDPDREERGGPSVRDFLESADGAMTLGHLEPVDLMQVLPMRLQGTAKTFFRTFMDSKGLTQHSPELGDHWQEFSTSLTLARPGHFS